MPILITSGDSGLFVFDYQQGHPPDLVPFHKFPQPSNSLFNSPNLWQSKDKENGEHHLEIEEASHLKVALEEASDLGYDPNKIEHPYSYTFQ